MKKISMFVCAVLLLSSAACGKTQVRVTNSTGSTLSSISVSVNGTGSSNPLTFSSVANGTTTDAQDWGSDSNFSAKTSVSGYTVTTDSNTLKQGSLNTLTLTLSSGNIVVTQSAD